jgi:predicted kinase
MELALLIGLQGSGKSSFARAHFGDTHLLVSMDFWPKARRPARRQASVVSWGLAAGRAVLVDGTNPTREARAPLIALGRAYGAEVFGYYLAAAVADCLARNAARTGAARVPDVAIFATAKRLERPSLEEGFAALYYVEAKGGGFAVSPWRG